MHYKTQHEEWSWFPILISFWKEDIDEETEIWRPRMCQLYGQPNACKNAEDCCDRKKIKDTWLLALLVKSKKKSLSLISIVLLSGIAFSINVFDNLIVNVNMIWN